MDMSTINWLGVFIAALSTFALGGLWYSPALFGKAWMRENNFSDDDMKKGNMAKIFGLSFVWSLVMAANLAMFLNDTKTDTVWGTTAGFLAGFGWAAMIFTAIALFEQRTWKYILINGGYIIVYFSLMGFILGIWR